jgi:hypothetical protein
LTRRRENSCSTQALRGSFWSRNFIVNPLMVLGGLVVFVVYVVLPIYIYQNRLDGVCCAVDEGTALGCASGNASSTNAGGSGAGARRLLDGGIATVEHLLRDPLEVVAIA